MQNFNTFGVSEGKTEGLLVSVYLFISVIAKVLSRLTLLSYILLRDNMRFHRCLSCHHYMGRKEGPRLEYHRLE